MDKDTIPVLVLVLIVFIVGFFFITSRSKKAPKAEITNEATNQYNSESGTTPASGSQDTTMAKQNEAAGQKPELTIDENKKYTAVLNTTAGTIKVELNAKQTPITVNNFVTLARKGFYNDTIFHRVIDGFMIQGGDPKGDGTGGPGYKFEDEPFEGEYTRGTIAMANAGPDTNGSQFFIMHKDYALPPNYTIFGKTVEGLETVDTIATAKTSMSPNGESSKPVNPVVVTSIEIIEE